MPPAQVTIFRTVVAGRVELESDRLSDALSACRRARSEGKAARIENVRVPHWPPFRP